MSRKRLRVNLRKREKESGARNGLKIYTVVENYYYTEIEI